MRAYIPVLSIAGSDSSGGAGIQADIKTISALGCYAMTAITAVTAQNTCGVAGIEGISPAIVEAQLKCVFDDIPPLAIKTGMLFEKDIIETIALFLNNHRVDALVVDPVMVATSGSRLISEDAVKAMKTKLFPLATIVTPNRMEAAYIAGSDNIADQIDCFRALGCSNLLIKGGDSDDKNTKTDFLALHNSSYPIELKAPAVDTTNTHGTGCTLSSAIACYLALGCNITQAVTRAKHYVTEALSAGANVHCGNGHGPMNHFYGPQPMIIK